jgi:hypothetical protein
VYFAVKLASGSLVVISAIKLTECVRRAIKSSGGVVKYILAPNLEHYMRIGDWKRTFPDAKVIGPELLPQKCAKNPSLQNVQFDILYTSSNRSPSVSEEFDREFEVEYMHSMASQDIVLFHKPSKTVIEADVLFNVPATEQFSKSGQSATSGILFHLAAPLFSAKGSATWQKWLAWHVLSSKDRSGFTQSLEKISSWNFELIIPCHGDVIESGAKQVFAKVFERFLVGENARI